MRIGLVTKWIDEDYTGVGKYVRNLAQNLIEMDKRNDYYLVHGKESQDPIYKTAKEMRYKTSFGPLWVRSLNAFVKKNAEKLDVIHEPFIGISAKADIKKVVSVHDITPLLFPSTVPLAFRLYFKHMMPKVLQGSDAIITVSEHTKKDVIEHFGVDKEKVHMIHVGCEMDFPDDAARAAARKRLGPKSGTRRYCLMVGSMLATKNMAFGTRVFGEAVKAMGKEGEDLDLVIVGRQDQDTPNILAAAKATGMEERLKMVSYIPWSEVCALYEGAALFLFPSLYEGFGRPPLEAMYVGVPTICSNTSSIPEVVGDASILLGPKDEDAWTKAMIRVLTDEKERARLIEKGKARSVAYPWSTCAEKTIAVYESLGKKA